MVVCHSVLALQQAYSRLITAGMGSSPPATLNWICGREWMAYRLYVPSVNPSPCYTHELNHIHL